MTVEQIIKDCGGPDAIATAAAARGKKLTSWGVYKWHSNGIPEKHWALVVELSSATVEQIFSANNVLRSAAASAPQEAAQ